MTSRNSQRVPPCSAREPRPVTSTTGRGNPHDALGGHRLIAPEAQNHCLDNFPDQPGTVVLIGIARHGLGTIVRPFLFKSFHHSEIARG
jgi:hypothetical protein